MKILKTTFTAVLLTFCATATANWPTKNVSLHVGFAAGGPTDVAARVFAKELAKETGKTVIVENKPGASGVIASSSFSKLSPDSHNLMVLVVPTVFRRIFDNKTTAYDAEISPVSKFYSHNNVLVVNADFANKNNIRTVKDLVTYQKNSKEPLAFTSAGNGSIGHLAGQKLATMAGIEMQHISYKGAAPALNDTLGGQIPVMFGDYTTLLQHIKAQKIVPIAVASKNRLEGLEEVGTLVEQGFTGLVAVPWGGIVVNTAISAAEKSDIEAVIKKIMESKDFQDQITKAGLIPDYTESAVWKKQINDEFELWKKVVEENNIISE